MTGVDFSTAEALLVMEGIELGSTGSLTRALTPLKRPDPDRELEHRFVRQRADNARIAEDDELKTTTTTTKRKQ